MPIFLSLLVVSLAAFGCRGTDPVEAVIQNGIIYTGNPSQPRAEALAVEGGRIVSVGSNAAVQAMIGPQTRVIDLAGNTAVPGLTDSHRHLDGVGRRERILNLEGTASLEDLLEKVRVAVSQKRPSEWIVGRGWIESRWPVPRFPTRADVDRIAPDNPVFLARADGHGSVSNSRALSLGGVTRNTPNPFGGEILKDPRTGEPNGMLLDSAQNLVRRHIPAPSEADLVEDLRAGMESTLAQGWTGIHIPGGSFAEVERLRALYQSGAAKLRIYYAIRGPSDDARRLLDEGAQIGLFGHRLTVRSIKVTLDGALGSRGAALLEPYADAPGSGFLTQQPDEVLALSKDALRRGIQMMVHAIGDRANRELLNIYERAFSEVPAAERAVSESRFRNEHSQILHPDDLPRFARLGVIASMQPSHAITDLHFAPSRLGIERLAASYAWRSLLASGATIAGGSDAPVERGDARIEFYAAVARRDLSGFQGEGWRPQEKVTREEALRMFTTGAAYAAFEEDSKGTLEPGKLADLSVFSKDILTVPEAEILDAEPVMTIIGGEVAWQRTQGGNPTR